MCEPRSGAEARVQRLATRDAFGARASAPTTPPCKQEAAEAPLNAD